MNAFDIKPVHLLAIIRREVLGTMQLQISWMLTTYNNYKKKGHV